MPYDYIAIPQAEIPRAVEPLLQLLRLLSKPVTFVWGPIADQAWEGAGQIISADAAGRK